MGKMGKFSVSDLKKLQKQLEKVQQSGDADALMEACAKELAARLLAKVVKRTPVGDYSKEITVTAKRDGKKHKKGEQYTKNVNPSGKMGGTLRRGWTIGEIQKEGGVYKVEVINPIEYASYVEYGHRQTPGRYVPALGKQLKQGWSEGHFMLTISEQELQQIAPKVLETKIKKFLSECMK